MGCFGPSPKLGLVGLGRLKAQQFFFSLKKIWLDPAPPCWVAKMGLAHLGLSKSQ